MAHPRAYQNMTMLPDGTVLVSGGMTTSDGTDLTKAVLPAEIWNPDTETWTTVASLQNGREYHSTALLLPDGRVLMSGGGRLGGRAENQDNAEIYSPPYLFKGPRPTITASPPGAGYGATFDVSTPNAAQISKVSLIRSPSVTHAIDMNQRFQFLNFTPGTGKVTVTAPANANLAPPGDYLLYLVDTNGVPSTGSFVRLSTTGDTEPPSAPTGLSAVGTSGQVALSWGASSDPSGIARYNVHRSTTAGFTPSTANRVAQPTTTTYTDLGVVAGTYYYKVTADDNAGNTGAAIQRGERGGPAAAPCPDSSARGDSTRAAARRPPTSRGATTTGRCRTRPGRRSASSGTRSRSTARTRSCRSPTPTRSTLTTGITMEGWVRPSIGAGWQTLLVKERPGNIVYGVYSSTDRNAPETQVTATVDAVARTARRRSRPGCGRTSPERTTGRRTASTSTAARSRSRPSAGAILTSTGAAQDRRQRDLVRVVQRPDRRGSALQPRAQRGRDPDRHEHRDHDARTPSRPARPAR